MKPTPNKSPSATRSAPAGSRKAGPTPSERPWYLPRSPNVLGGYALGLMLALAVGFAAGKTGVWVIALAVYAVAVLLGEIVVAYNRHEEAARKRPTDATILALAHAALAGKAPLDPRHDPRNSDTGPIEGPPEEAFWEKYNKRLEFPLSTVGSVFIHVVIGWLLIYVITTLMNSGDRSDVPIKLASIGGLDDFGDGSPGSGGIEDPIQEADANPLKAAVESLPDPTRLPEVKEDIQKSLRLIDPTGNLPITAENAAALAQLDKSIRDKLLGARRGSGSEAGRGNDGSKGTGPGGTGANSTLGRGLRWTLRFRITSGRDYLEQLRTLGAKLLIPIPGTAQCVVIEDLGNPRQRKTIGQAELDLYGGLRFSDPRRDVVGSLARTLELDFNPTVFFAVFSKEFEEDLAAKETAYRNRRPEDIEVTVFRVTVRGGSYHVVVDEQQVKR